MKFFNLPNVLPHSEIAKPIGIFSSYDGVFYSIASIDYIDEAEDWAVPGNILMSQYTKESNSIFYGWIEPEAYSLFLSSLVVECSPHYMLVRAFMDRIYHEAPESVNNVQPKNKPTPLSRSTIRSRVLLELEETQEFLDSLGVTLYLEDDKIDLRNLTLKVNLTQQNLIDLTDALADKSVINTGHMIAAGIKDGPLLLEVNLNNIRKFDGDYSFNKNGKLIKPKDHPKPDIEGILNAQTDITF